MDMVSLHFEENDLNIEFYSVMECFWVIIIRALFNLPRICATVISVSLNGHTKCLLPAIDITPAHFQCMGVRLAGKLRSNTWFPGFTSHYMYLHGPIELSNKRVKIWSTKYIFKEIRKSPVVHIYCANLIIALITLNFRSYALPTARKLPFDKLLCSVSLDDNLLYHGVKFGPFHCTVVKIKIETKKMI